MKKVGDREEVKFLTNLEVVKSSRRRGGRVTDYEIVTEM